MNRTSYGFFFLLSIPLTWGAAPVWGQCGGDQTVVIASEKRCFESGGIDIGYYQDEGFKVACMKDARVRGACGPDGQLTRLHAYSAWLNKLKEFEATCASQGGVFAFKDPNFIEPSDESFCMQSQPEVGSNMFEESLCNFRSACPSVPVTCSRPCSGEGSSASEFGGPDPVRVSLR